MSGRYAGLRTYSLYQELMSHNTRFEEGVVEYSEAIGDQNRPAVVIRGWQNASLHIEYDKGQFNYQLKDDDNEPLEIAISITENFKKLSSIADSLLMKAS
jgi:hypothetical protein